MLYEEYEPGWYERDSERARQLAFVATAITVVLAFLAAAWWARPGDVGAVLLGVGLGGLLAYRNARRYFAPRLLRKSGGMNLIVERRPGS